MDERFGRYVKSIRRNKGIPVEAIGMELNMPSMLWLDIENGELKPPRLGKLFKLSEILHLSASERDHMLQLAGNEMEATYEANRNLIPILQELTTSLDYMEASPSPGIFI